MNGGNNDNNKRRPSSTAVDDQAYFQLLYEDAGKSQLVFVFSVCWWRVFFSSLFNNRIKAEKII